MELNREQAIDILERFDFFQGQRAGRELWNDKPFDVQEQDIAKFSQDVASLKNYINKLTEENERLRAKGEWISVADRLPERNGRYLTHCNIEGQSLVCVLYYSKIGSFNEGTVTHWMPLPKVPKGE